MGTVNNYGNILIPSGDNTIDVQSLLDSALAATEIPLGNLEQQQNTLQTQISALQSIQTDMTTLSNAVTALTSTGGALGAFTATSSDSSVLTGSADSTATAGTHSIVVNSVATTSSYYTDPVASGGTISNGSFQIAVGSSSPVTVTVDSTDNTLAGLASAINGQNIGVTASVINDANGQRLSIVSNTSGAPGVITISNNTTSLNFNNTGGGTNGSLTVDGVPVATTSNTVTGVIPGVTLNLVGANQNETVNLTIAPDTSQATSAINSFVAAWNQVIGDLNSQFDVSSNGTGGGPLEADNNLRNIQDQLLSAITQSVTGNDGLVNLASIGVNMNNDGTLTVDSGTLSNALSSNFGDVQNLLQGAAGVATFLASTMTQINDPTQGSLTLDLQGMNSESQDLTQQIDNMQTNLITQQQQLTSEYAQMEVTLQEMPQLQSQLSQQLTSLG